MRIYIDDKVSTRKINTTIITMQWLFTKTEHRYVYGSLALTELVPQQHHRVLRRRFYSP